MAKKDRRKRGHGKIRRSQAVTTWGPGALLDLPRYAVIVGGLDTWPRIGDLEEITEPRLARKLELMTGLKAPRLYAPPVSSGAPDEKALGIGVWRFPEWFVVQEKRSDEVREGSRRLVHRQALDERSRFDGRQVVPTRFVRACGAGHIDDIDWRRFVHGKDDTCKRQLWLDEKGTSGDLTDLVVRCECERKPRSLYEATLLEENPLGYCSGTRPWLGRYAHEPDCKQHSRLLIRTATSAYFPQKVSVLSIPEDSAVKNAVESLWDDLSIVDDAADLHFIKKKPKVIAALALFDDQQVLEAILELKGGKGEERPVKQVELDALLAAPEGYGDDVPVDPDFHARRLPKSVWRRQHWLSDGIQTVIQIHRLREVVALTGFTRFDPIMPDIHGEYKKGAKLSALALDPQWFPAVENRGEGLFLQLRGAAVENWLERPAVKRRLDQLNAGHEKWKEHRKSKRDFPKGPYILLHTLSHLLIESLAMRCGYPASSIRERVYVDYDDGRYGLLLYPASPDADGPLGGLVSQARHIETHLAHALRTGALCSNDPICAQHTPGDSLDERWLQGAACHGCALIAETSCEMRYDYLARAVVVPTLATADAAFFIPRRGHAGASGETP